MADEVETTQERIEHHDYDGTPLERDDLSADPLDQLRAWIEVARSTDQPEPTAMVLGTVDPDGRPATRTVLCRGIDHGVICYTNLDSTKGRHIAATGVAAATFLWLGLSRQINVRGRTEPVDDATADGYFATRPRGSQVSAWASPQSQPVADREELARRTADVEARFPDAIPRPPRWAGIRIVPDIVEVWQGRPSRLHDRFAYTRTDTGWDTQRLAP